MSAVKSERNDLICDLYSRTKTDREIWVNLEIEGYKELGSVKAVSNQLRRLRDSGQVCIAMIPIDGPREDWTAGKWQKWFHQQNQKKEEFLLSLSPGARREYIGNLMEGYLGEKQGQLIKKNWNKLNPLTHPSAQGMKKFKVLLYGKLKYDPKWLVFADEIRRLPEFFEIPA